jgi:hypothetical protein
VDTPNLMHSGLTYNENLRLIAWDRAVTLGVNGFFGTQRPPTVEQLKQLSLQIEVFLLSADKVN